ncbi:MAG TPA: RodZ domain-containing protein [Stellaceae bacterium]|nr:RodZ domain-containing protein [Stellaceae bacterium]
MHPWALADRPLSGIRLLLAHPAASLALGWRALRGAMGSGIPGSRPTRDGVALVALEDEFDPAGFPGTRLPSVGTVLRDARKSMGGDLGRISAALRIRPEHLRAIEAGNYADLPARAYALGFIRSYADYLGLDAAELVRRLKQEMGERHLTHELSFPEPLREPSLSLGGALVGLAILGLCALGTWWLSADRPDRDVTVAAPPAALVPPPSAAAPGAAKTTDAPSETMWSLSPAAGPASLAQVRSDAAAAHKIEVERALGLAPPAEAARSAGGAVATSAPSTGAAHVFGVTGDGHYRIALRATAETWLEVKDGDTSVFRQLLEPGDEYRVPEKPGLTLRVGNAHGIQVLAGGKPLPSSAQPSQGHRTVVTLEARELLARAGMQ